jgi:hypothetical protein
VKGHHAARALAAGALASALLGLPGLSATAQAASSGQHERGRDCGRDEGRRDRDRGCSDRRESRRSSGDRSRWERFHDDDNGDCFRTPWGLACETDQWGVFRVRDRHPGDEPGPDCDLLIVEDWGWRCVDLPGR